mmetsp:Transcript_20889/g.32585  ORF Transcript_20889/g.32585 Transcript_20889/m.32585 type:complete len:139 (-) Transcript_20889:86-502(-)
MFTDTQTIGMMFTLFGFAFTFMGVILFFDSILIAMGNLLFFCGMLFLIGPMKTVEFFSQTKNLRPSICFLVGICLVIFGYSFFGLILEGFGFFKLFGKFFPYLFITLRGMPVIGQIMMMPPLRQLSDYVINEGKPPPV